ncbi:MAG TPA: hypothetical protein IAB35_02720 [Candidatus Faecimonas gallistercoris]|nr:hypothetical protein [Candidatus Faecimonas gallistercoris]
MRSLKKIIMMVLVGAFVLVPMINVHAEDANTKQVSTGADFLAAIKDESVTKIELTQDIEITERGVITTAKEIDGNGYKITYTGGFKNGGDKTTWGSDTSNGDGIYVILAWHTNVTLKDITLTGGNVGLSANGANVTLEGTINVSGNGFGGIEVTDGGDDPRLPSLTINGTIVNTTETAATPTLWTDGLTDEEVATVNIEYNGVQAAAYRTDKGQVQLFLNTANTPEGENYTALNADDYKPEPVEEPTEEPTTPVEENPTQGRVEDTTENPETSDGILLFVSLAVIGLAGTAVTYRRLHN